LPVLPDYSFSPWVLPYAAGAVVTLLLVVEVLRIPFRRIYHQVLAIETAALCAFFVDRALGATANTPAAYLPLSRAAVYLFPALLALSYHFIVAYTNIRPSGVLRYSLFVSYGVMLLFWGTLVIDEHLLIPGAVKTPAGLYADAPGPVEPLLLGYWFFAGALATLLLVRFYLRLPQNIVKQQTKYLLFGVFLFNFGGITLGLARDFGNPPLDWLLGPIAIAVALIGFRKHGFAFVTAAEESQSSMPPRYSIPAGRTYLAVEPEAKGAFETFADLIRHGYQGLCITRAYPDNIRKTYNLTSTPVRWLTQSTNNDAIAPTDLLGLSVTVNAFLQSATNPVVMLHGVEYLVTNNGFRPTLMLVQRLNDIVAERRGILLLPLEPRSLSERQEALLASECARLSGPESPEVRDAARLKGATIAQGRGLVAVMFADIVDYSAMVQKNERAALTSLDDEQRLVRPIIQRQGGREVKSLGDGLLVEFGGAVEAVSCATMIQKALEERNGKLPPERRVKLRIGVHLGDVVYKDGDLLGDTVNIASRVEAVAEAGEICVSQRVYDQVRNKVDCNFVYLGPKQFKNIQVPVGVYRVGQSAG
jgi:class 3 adenylate cyclase